MGGLRGVYVLVRRSLGTLLILAFWSAMPALAQGPVGTIFGTVKDSSGGVVAGATVTATNAETAASRSATTGDDGAYRFAGLAVGHYDVKAEHAGFKPLTQSGLVLDIGQEAVVNFGLEIGTATQEVVVTGEAPQVNTTSGTLGGLVNEEKIAELPLNGRNYEDLTLLQPGVTRNTVINPSGGGTLGTIYSSNGAPITSNNYLIDGATMGTIFGLNGASAVGTTLGVDGIREYKVVTSAFGAEYGMTMGSQMTLVSKGGSNQFHGDAFEYMRNAVLDARNYFDTYSQSHPGKRNPQYQRNNFGGAFGGPIKKDKTFFWGVYEGLRQEKGIVYTSVVPAAACHPANTPLLKQLPGESFVANPGTGANDGTITSACDSSLTGSATYAINPNIAPILALYPVPNSGSTGFSYTFTNPTSVDYGQIRVDQNLSASDSLFGRYTITDSATTIGGQQPAFAGPQITETSTSREQYLTLGETHIFSPSLLNTAHLSYTRTLIPTGESIDSSLYSPSVAWSCPTGTAPCLQAMGDVFVGGISIFGPDNPIPNYHYQSAFTLSEDMFYTKGKHAFKFGFLGNKFQVRDRENGTVRGQLKFNGTSTTTGLSDFLHGINAQEVGAVPGSQLGRVFNWYTYGFYVQDDWRVTSRLTVNLGMRYEFNTTPIEHNGLQANVRNLFTDVNAISTVGPIMVNPSKKNFSPRLGFAWDVLGDGKTAVHGAFGIYYDVGAAMGQILFNTAATVPPFSALQTINGQTYSPGFLQSASPNPLFKSITPAMYANPSLFFTNLPGCGTPGNAACTAFPRGSLTPFGPSYYVQQPYLMQWNLTLDRQLPWNTALSVGYVGTRGIHLFDYQDNNGCVPMAVVNGFPNWANSSNTSCPVSPLQAAYPYTTAPVNGRFNQNFGTMTQMTTGSESWYNGLQVSLTRKLKNGLEFQSAYTYSRSLDTTEGMLLVEGNYTTVNFNLPLVDKGPSAFDATHNWRFNTIYHVPDIKSDGVGSGFVKGWWVSNIIAFQSGYPFNPALGTNRSLDGQQGGGPGNADRASLVTSANLPAITSCAVGGSVASGPYAGWTCNPNAVVYNPSTVITGDPSHWFNQNMFAQQAAGFLGNEGRNILRGPGLFDWDLSVNKDTRLPFLGEAGMVEFKADFFNIFNHPNFSFPTYGGGGTSNIFSATPGKILSTATDSRDIQLALKLVF